MAKSAQVATKTLVLFGGGYSSEKERRVDIPASSEILFEIIERKGHGLGVLTVYEGVAKTTPILAVFTGVENFRYESIAVRELVHRENGKSVWKSDETGLSVDSNYRRERALVARS